MSDTPGVAGRVERRGAQASGGAGGRGQGPGRPASRAEAAPMAGSDAQDERAARSGGSRGAARTRIGIRELRQHASVYVDLAEKGYTVDITNRGRLVAQLVPVREPDSPLERLIAAGLIEAAEESGGAAGLDPYPARTGPR